MGGLYHSFPAATVFIHVLSAFVWVGGMIAVRFAVHPMVQGIEHPKVRLGRTLAITGRFFNIVILFVLLLLLTGLSMALAMHGHQGEQKMLFMVKETIWMVMAINFAVMYIKRRGAQKLFDGGELLQAKASLALIPKLLLPINIVLGVVALWLGVLLRGL